MKKNSSISKNSRSLKLFPLIICGFVLTLASGIFTLIGGYLHYSQDLPRIFSLKNYRPPTVTTLYSDDNRKIAEFYKERRIVIPLSQMPRMLVLAFIAAEDSRFFTHNGVDYTGIVRAFLKNMEAGTIVQGGSTITQQLIKQFLLSSAKGYERKIKEAILAYQIDREMTKEEILFLYLNQIYLGHGAYGVESAAENYFGKSAKDLNLAECAMLAGLPKAPSAYSPYRYPEKAKARQRYVLDRMLANAHITEAQASEALKIPLNINPRRNWYREQVPYFSEHIRRYVERKFGQEALYEGGLKIYTTVNIEAQKAALEEIRKGLDALNQRQKYPGKDRPQAGLVCIESISGHVKAMVGGRDFRESQLNRVVQSRRQPGSAFKPMIYAAALDKGFTPITRINDSQVTYWNPETRTSWSPVNYDKKFYGPISFRKALEQSRNVPAVKLLQRIGIDYAISYARKLGIESDLNKGLSLALGPSSLSLLEIVTAYSVFANLGELVHPVFIRKITDRDGNEIQEIPFENERAIEGNTAYIMTHLLEGVVQRGTGRRVLALQRPAAGKTGTSSNLHDAWFIGYTPRYVTGTWVGFDMARSLGEKETGSRAASPIWLEFMKQLLADEPVRQFQVPTGVVFARGECFKEGKVPPEDTGNSDAFAWSSAPDATAVPRKSERLQRGTVTGMEQFFKSTM